MVPNDKPVSSFHYQIAPIAVPQFQKSYALPFKVVFSLRFSRFSLHVTYRVIPFIPYQKKNFSETFYVFRNFQITEQKHPNSTQLKAQSPLFLEKIAQEIGLTLGTAWFKKNST